MIRCMKLIWNAINQVIERRGTEDEGAKLGFESSDENIMSCIAEGCKPNIAIGIAEPLSVSFTPCNTASTAANYCGCLHRNRVVFVFTIHSSDSIELDAQ